MVRYESGYAGRYKHWSSNDVNLLKRLARKNESVAMIARRLNRSVGAVRARAYAEGISLARNSGEQPPVRPERQSAGQTGASSACP